MQTTFAVEALMEGYDVLVLDFYSSGLEILNELKHQLKKQYSDKSFKEQQKFRGVFRELSHRLLLEVSENKLSVKKAPFIGWFEKLYPDLEEFLLPFPQIQGLNSAWQWYVKGIHIPVIEKKIYPWFGTYFPTRFEHLELFDEWLKTYRGERETAIDIGIGSGILSLQMLKHGFENIIGTDNNPNAIIGLNEYLSREGLTDKIQIHYGDLFTNCPEQVDLIIFNPPWLPITRNVEGIEKAMYYDSELFPRFFEQASKHLKPEGKLLIIFSNLAQITHTTKSHPIEEELASTYRFKKEELLKKKVKSASKKTKRNLSRRAEEEVELWVLRVIQ
ncbi:MAG: methyltransferase [Bacteroidales bacterium]|nr:methyltransferase [Bacteroidales bacterium]